MISIQTNIDSLLAQQNLSVNSQFQSNTIQQLTSGYRINSSADDAAGLSVANGYRNQIAELNQGVLNANQGVSQLQIIDGGLSNISQMLDRLQTLATEGLHHQLRGIEPGRRVSRCGDRNNPRGSEYRHVRGEHHNDLYWGRRWCGAVRKHPRRDC